MYPGHVSNGERMRRVSRWSLATLLAILAGAFPAVGIAFAVQNGQASQRTYVDTIDTRDREFLKTIRFANLWEIPMSDLALERGTTKEVKAAAEVMHNDHIKLQTVVEGLAQKYGMTLPSQASASQQAWMAEISGKQGEDFDRAFVNRFRGAHGSIFQAIAEERAGTRNKTMLDFATQANTIVMTHMTVLERTGYVTDAGHFAEAGARTIDYAENALSSHDLFLGGLVFVLVAGATVLTIRALNTKPAQ
jgi:putative membrane protein